MSAGHATPTLTAGRRLPRLALRHTQDGQTLEITCHGRQSMILLALHGECEACAAYAQDVAQQAGEIAAWDCRVLVVATSPADDAAGTPWPVDENVASGFAPADALAAAAVPVPAVLVADPWCELAAVLEAGTAHGFPAVAELLEWARHLGTRCPECEGEAL